MNSRSTTVSRLMLPLLAGAFFWSSWLQTARLALSSRMQPYLDAGAAHKPLPRPLTARQRQALSSRLGEVMSDPGKIKQTDLDSVKAAWGEEYGRLLGVLKSASSN